MGGGPGHVQAYQQAPRNSCCSRCSRRKGCPEHVYFKEDYVQGASREVLSGIDGGLECGLGSECRRYALPEKTCVSVSIKTLTNKKDYTGRDACSSQGLAAST